VVRQGGAYFVSQQRYRRHRHVAFFVITLVMLAAVRGCPSLRWPDAPRTHRARASPSGSSGVGREGEKERAVVERERTGGGPKAPAFEPSNHHPDASADAITYEYQTVRRAVLRR
jgi:hypothetical protein